MRRDLHCAVHRYLTCIYTMQACFSYVLLYIFLTSESYAFLLPPLTISFLWLTNLTCSEFQISCYCISSIEYIYIGIEYIGLFYFWDQIVLVLLGHNFDFFGVVTWWLLLITGGYTYIGTPLVTACALFPNMNVLNEVYTTVYISLKNKNSW